LSIPGHLPQGQQTLRKGFQQTVYYFAATTPPTVDDPVPLHPFPP
jgi:hypothetical protein